MLMRAVSFLLFVLGLGAIVVWQTPGWLPEVSGAALLRDQIAAAFHSLVAPSAAGMPVWGVVIAALAAAGAVGGALWLRARSKTPAAEPRWIENARVLAPKSRHLRDYQRQCDQLRDRLAPDIQQRGRAALARAHQLDLYWRFVGRNRTSKNGRAEGLHYQRWVATTRATLRAVALTPEGRLMSAYQTNKPSLNIVGGPASLDVGGFYDALGGRVGQYEAAWLRAYSELAKPEVNRDAVLVAMEKLRCLNKDIAEDAARLHGPIEIAVRAVN